MPRSLIYRLKTVGGSLDALIDSGAELTLISEEVVKKRGLLAEPLEKPLYIVFADQTRALASQCIASLPVSYSPWSDVLRCVVVPSLSEQLFLGRDWLYRWNPVIDWVSGTLTVPGGGPLWVPKGDTEPKGKPEEHESWLGGEMTPLEFQKWFRTSSKSPATPFAYAALVIVRATSVPAAEASLHSVDVQLQNHPSLVQTLMDDFPNVFEEAKGVEPNPPVCHPIWLQDSAKPSHVKPYRFSETQKNEMREQISLLLHKGWIHPFSSPWGAPVLLVPQKDGTWRFCIDFRNLNAVTVRDSFPLPRIDDLLHKVGQAAVFSKMDMQSGFHQVPMEEDAVETTAFSLPEAVEGSSHFEWIVMPFGLMNAPSTFQRLVSRVLVGCEAFTAAYIDDILVFSHDEQQHQQHLRKVLECLARHNLRVKLKKCSFFQQEMPFLGHVLS